MYIYESLLDASVADVQVAQITIPTGRTLQAGDILISSYESSVGAMAQVVSIADGVATVNFIGQISAGGGGGGGTTLNQYFYDLRCSTSDISMSRLLKIIRNAKGKVCISIRTSDPGTSLTYSINSNSHWIFTGASIKHDTANVVTFATILCNISTAMVSSDYSKVLTVDLDNPLVVTTQNIVGSSMSIRTMYYNDTEITL